MLGIVSMLQQNLIKKFMFREDLGNNVDDSENFRKKKHFNKRVEGVSHQVFSREGELKVLSIPSSRKSKGKMLSRNCFIFLQQCYSI